MLSLPPLIESLLKTSLITQAERQLISSHLNFITLKKGEHFSKAGKICDRLGILDDGLLYANFQTEKEKLCVSRFFFHPQNIIVTSFDSFKNKTYSNETITAITTSTLYYFNSKDLEKLTDQITGIDKVIRHLAEESYILALQRIHDLQVLNTRERVQKFFLNNSELFNLASKIHLASYLRVHRNDLSKFIAELE